MNIWPQRTVIIRTLPHWLGVCRGLRVKNVNASVLYGNLCIIYHTQMDSPKPYLVWGSLGWCFGEGTKNLDFAKVFVYGFLWVYKGVRIWDWEPDILSYRHICKKWLLGGGGCSAGPFYLGFWSLEHRLHFRYVLGEYFLGVNSRTMVSYFFFLPPKSKFWWNIKGHPNIWSILASTWPNSIRCWDILWYFVTF